MIAEILEYLQGQCQTLGGLPAIIGQIPPADGIGLYLGAGSPSDEFLDRGKEHDLNVVVNAKSNDQQTALAALDTIHSALTRLKTYPAGDDWQIVNIATGTAPNYIGPDANDQQYLYGSILRLTVNQTGG